MTNEKAKFHVYLDGPAVIVLDDGQSFQWELSCSHEEGFHYECQEFYFDGEYVHMDRYSNDRDCDGRVSSEVNEICPVSELASGDEIRVWIEDSVEFYPSGWFYPKWESVSFEVNDQFARAARY